MIIVKSVTDLVFQEYPKLNEQTKRWKQRDKVIDLAEKVVLWKRSLERQSK